MERVNGKCDHGVYWPAGDSVNRGCQQCNPEGLGAGDAPILPRSSGDVLTHQTPSLDYCTCGNVRTFSFPNCRVCGKPFPDIDRRSRTQFSANSRQAGTCPKCNSAVHYQTKKKGQWECVDCGTVYVAPKLKDDEQSAEI